ncbi:hypothetical protein PFISCL1PPCAC_9853, partial [Pristionchus fissidentatus]
CFGWWLLSPLPLLHSLSHSLDAPREERYVTLPPPFPGIRLSEEYPSHYRIRRKEASLAVLSRVDRRVDNQPERPNRDRNRHREELNRERNQEEAADPANRPEPEIRTDLDDPPTSPANPANRPEPEKRPDLENRPTSLPDPASPASPPPESPRYSNRSITGGTVIADYYPPSLTRSDRVARGRTSLRDRRAARGSLRLYQVQLWVLQTSQARDHPSRVAARDRPNRANDRRDQRETIRNLPVS